MKSIQKSSAILTFFILIFGLLTINVSAQSHKSKIDALLKKYKEYEQFNGSVLVADQGNLIINGGYGMANMEWGIDNDADTKHRLGSITKQFTSMLIMLLVEEGKLDLSVPITTYLTDYPKTTGDKITIHHLLTHSSGIPNYTSFPNFFNEKSRNPYEVDVFIKEFSDMALEFEPGSTYKYSNSGYFLLGAIAEKVTGNTYEQELDDRIFTPLKMANTGFDHHATILKKRATGYQKNGSNYSNSDYLDMSIPYAAGSLYSTADDLYIWDKSLSEGLLLSEENYKIMMTGYIKAWGGSYAYGWGVRNVYSEKKKDSVMEYSHGGGINGFNTLITRVPAEKNVVILLNNTGGAPLNEITVAINAILDDKPYDLPKMSLADALLETFNDDGIDKGMAQYDELKNHNEYNLDEGQMNRAGYSLLQSGKVKEAIALFTINVQEFPESSNPYDSLAEAYLADGQKDLALKNYKKAFEMDPKNENAKKIIDELEANK
ncbi:serine hydrolase [Lutimonas halocynthiae]|uniref:serine hydrolase n=1 Tax=Lutimonas halocynthiae TaxID=1446477 RepID=UPI0025B43651|nr:serine hydrolase [Lutimonas halocynthiae]MDN3641133.1 serine hydrolase [Lutimonas halocynthiae]